jgi:hypothetical protein
MMRSRNIKPGFFLNEELADIEPPWGRICFAGLWCMADREGRLEDRSRRIKAEVFPYDEKMPSIEKILSQLAAKNFILRYQIEKEKYIQINKFKKHQHPHNTERQSTIPEPLINGELTVDPPFINDGNRVDSLIPDSSIPDSLNPDLLIPDSPIQIDNARKNIVGGKPATTPAVRLSVNDLAVLWNDKRPPELAAVNLPFKRPPKELTKLKAALKRNPDRDWWLRVVAKIRESPFLLGANKRGWKASFDFMVDRAEVILDGKYDGGGRGGSQPGLTAFFKKTMEEFDGRES